MLLTEDQQKRFALVLGRRMEGFGAPLTLHQRALVEVFKRRDEEIHTGKRRSHLAGRGVGRRGEANDLSGREVEVLAFVADGYSNVEIAKMLFLSEETIKTHVKHTIHKLHAKNRTHAAALGLRAGLIV